MALLKVVARMDSPTVLRDALHLDALLTAIHPASGKDGPVTRGTPLSDLPDVRIPVARWDGLRICSAAQLPEGARRTTEYVTARPDGEDVDRMAGKVNRKSGPGKDQMIRLPIALTPTLTWYTWSSRTGTRSPRRSVLGLIRRVDAVGSYRRGGYGRVGRWEVEYVAGGSPVDAIYSGTRALRHLPSRWCAWAEREGTVSCAEPYWHPARQEVGVPAQTPCTLADRTLEKLHELEARSRESVVE